MNKEMKAERKNDLEKLTRKSAKKGIRNIKNYIYIYKS
jgi:hypothetical protein